MAKYHIVKGDQVKVIRGVYREAEGTVLEVDRDRGRVTVEGVNVRTKHQRPTQSNPEGGRITFPAPIDISNVMLLDPTSGEATRIRIREEADGTKERISVKSGNPIPKPAREST